MATHATTYLSDDVLPIIGKTGPRKLSGRINRIIDRQGEIIWRTDKDLDAIFTSDELRALAAVIIEADLKPAAKLERDVQMKLELATDSVFKKTARAAILGKVRGLSFVQLVALVERVRRISGSEE